MKRLDLTPKIIERLAATSGADIDHEKVAVYEVILLNTMPLTKKGTIFDGAKFTAGTLREMQDFFSTGETVPILQMHNNHELPIGTLFYAEAKELGDQVHTELRGLFYVDLTNEDIVSRLDQGIINEVSIGVLNKKILCSECGFDYLGEDSSFDNIWSLTCNEGHEIGVDGVHTNLVGIEQWMETSLVNRGAAHKPKIVGKSKSQLSEASHQRLAASGIPERAAILTATHTPISKQSKESTMDEKIVQLATDLGVANTELKAANETVASLSAENTQLKEKVAELEANNDGEALKAAKEDLAARDAELSTADEFISATHKAVLTAAGAEIGTDLSRESMIEEINTHSAKLAAGLPVGGVAEGADTPGDDDGQAVKASQYDAYRTVK